MVARKDDTHVQATGIVKSYGGTQALRGVSVTIRRGTVHALVGENGAGKSTLGKILAGIVPQDDGELVIDGEPVRFGSPREALGSGVTTISQELTLVPYASVMGNVFLGFEPRRLGAVDRKRMREMYAGIAERAGFDLPPDAIVHTLRVADQQKVEIMRALARKATLIVFDEPTAALAVDEIERLLDTLRALRDDGVTVVYVSHFLREVLAIADEITVLKDGALVRTTTAEGETPESLIESMLGRKLSTSFPPRTELHDPPVVLEVEGIRRGRMVRDVSFEVRAGEILGITGLVGSGRSETARLICGVDRAEGGRVSLHGDELTLRSPRDAYRHGIVMVPEDRKGLGLHLQRSITVNVTLPHLDRLSVAGTIRPGLEGERVREITTRLGVNRSDLRTAVGVLSGGNQQKVMYAKWLFERPEVLVVDEPTRGVDVGAKLALYELLVELAKEGMAIVLISSELEEVLGLAHRIVVMRNGVVVGRFDEGEYDGDAIMRTALADPTSQDNQVGVA